MSYYDVIRSAASNHKIPTKIQVAAADDVNICSDDIIFTIIAADVDMISSGVASDH